MEQRHWRDKEVLPGCPPPAAPLPTAAAARQPSLPHAKGRPARLPSASRGGSTSSAWRSALALAQGRQHQGQQRPTCGGWTGEELTVLSQLPRSQDTVTGALAFSVISRGGCVMSIICPLACGFQCHWIPSAQ